MQIPGGLGAYSDSRGALAIRKEARASSRCPCRVRVMHACHTRSLTCSRLHFWSIQVAEYIKNRDGLKDTPNPDHIFLTGARPLLHDARMHTHTPRMPCTHG